MKKFAFMAIVGVAMASAAPALAERWVEPNNGALSAITMPEGAVMMKVQVPEKEFLGLGRDMKAGQNTCIIKEVYPAAPNTMILVCGG